MSNRLKLFRERIAAFEVTADPSRAIDSNYYVDPPGKLPGEQISGRIALRPLSSHILIGGIGSGKTTQLLLACQKINQIQDIHAVYVDVSLYADISQISSGVLTVIAALELSEMLKESEDQSLQQSITLIRKLAFGYEGSYYQQNMFDMSGIPHRKPSQINQEGVLSDISDPYGVKSDLVKAASNLVKEAANQYGQIVLLFDGLDRLDDVKTFMQIMAVDGKAISSMQIGLVLVGSLISLYGDYSDTVHQEIDYYYQPFFDLEHDTQAYSFFKKIIQTRSSTDFIEYPAIQTLIYFSGGVLRDFITLTQSAIEETYLSGEDKVQKKHVLSAVDSFGRSQLLGLSNDELKILQLSLDIEKPIPRNNENLRLRIRRLILEYRSPKNRYTVHPAVKHLVERISF
ncbi:MULTISPECIES: hypothetical protein [unclassified Nodularia (in: cyanobacteria)]|uniref:hypothetical protein n=1 Tax=unclassified Nodularia (in: cyanobacteria) TaxID=2656917 RepID=UPI00187E9F0C|nr:MULTISPECIES: hypothetical protein [unclassified Nodularia (in: cyanobacteria)]MBE9201138.1 hypothetical protein [Nodularia sp. LEGE 06071]MCC2695017.1 hypothetical protein [Nodularia sp. LEGE 04288]